VSFPALIGIAGRAGVGKDTLAEYLHIVYGYHRYALAQPIVNVLSKRFGWTSEQWRDRAWKESPSEWCGANGIGQFSPRSWVQWLGALIRELVGDGYLAQLMVREWQELSCDVSGMVVSDVRLDCEAEAIRALGGVVIGVQRKAATPVIADKTEAGVSPALIDFTVLNNSTIANFLADASNALAWLDQRPIARTR
jgi:hypothetical protein